MICVLHLRDTYEIGGPGKTILETNRAIDGARFRLHLGVFCAHRESAETPFVQAAWTYGLPVHDICGANQYDPRMIRRVAELVDYLGVDIVHAHEVKSDVIAYLASRLRRVPIVTTVHGWIGNSSKQRALIAITKRLLRRFDRVIAVSGQIRDDLSRSGVPSNRLRLLHNAIVMERYSRSGRVGYLAALIGRAAVPPVIVAIGRLSPEKGQRDLVEALGILRERGTKASVVFAGDGPDRPAIEERARRLGVRDWVHLPGHVNEPQRLLEEADLMVLPSHTEGLPNAALEALAMEVPVLATAVGGTPEVVVDGETGRLVRPRDPEALATAIGDFLRDPLPWRHAAAAGRARVQRQFDFAARTRKLETIYAELMDEQLR